MTSISAIRTAAAVLALSLFAGSALAADEPSATVAPAPAAIPSEAQSDEVLDTLAGRGVATNVTALTEQDLTAVSSGNTINAANVGSGMINLQDNALSGFNGVGNFVMNTGHNNNLQSSLSVTIVVTQ